MPPFIWKELPFSRHIVSMNMLSLFHEMHEDLLKLEGVGRAARGLNIESSPLHYVVDLPARFKKLGSHSWFDLILRTEKKFHFSHCRN